jgi:hypothetical protein
MKPFHHITVFLISEQEKRAFLEAGVEFTALTRGPRGQCAILEIGEDDPRWERAAALVASLEGNKSVPKKYRVQDLAMTKPTFRESAGSSLKPPDWLDGYSGETVEELLALEGKYRTDSLVLAFEEAIRQREKHDASRTLSDQERVVLAVEALEREVNNGGYDQFFTNASRQFAPAIVDALERIGCTKTAAITRKAIKALGVSDLTVEAIDAAMASDDEQRLTKLNRCDKAYQKTAEPISERLFAYLKENKSAIGL